MDGARDGVRPVPGPGVADRVATGGSVPVATFAPRCWRCWPRSRCTATRSSRRSTGAAAEAWKPSPGSVYPTLQQLEDEGLVRAQEQDGRRVYRLTDDGQRVAADRAEEFATLWEGVAPSEDDTQLGDLIFQVGAAFVHVARTGTPEQMAEARKVLARTRADLYRILGDQDDGAEGSTRS